MKASVLFEAGRGSSQLKMSRSVVPCRGNEALRSDRDDPTCELPRFGVGLRPWGTPHAYSRASSSLLRCVVAANSTLAVGIEAIPGDMNEGLPEGPHDAIYFGNTSHMYGLEENKRLLTRMRQILAPGGLLVVREFVRGTSEEAALFAVNMLVLTPRQHLHRRRVRGVA